MPTGVLPTEQVPSVAPLLVCNLVTVALDDADRVNRNRSQDTTVNPSRITSVGMG